MKIVGIPIIIALALAACSDARRTRTIGTIPDEVVAKHVLNGLNQDIITFALADETLKDSVVAEVVRADEGYRQFIKYMVECALPADESIDFGDGIVLSGDLGLAPEWRDGPCGVACQEWVTACLAARTNAYGVNVDIGLDGDNDAIGVGSDIPVEEGAFYGNIFEPVPRYYACRGKGYDPLMNLFRVCSQPGGLCGMQWVGACFGVDGDTGGRAEQHACAEPPADGSFRECWNRPTALGGDTPAEPFRRYTRVIRVTLKKTGFTPGCDRPPWGPEAIARPDPLLGNTCEPEGPTDVRCLGQRCVNDDGCGGESYVCDNSSPIKATCAAPCVSSATQADEQAQCGGQFTTCMGVLGDPDPASGRCGIRCTPAGQPGQKCGPGQICTGSWYAQPDGTPDVLGCMPVCESDDDCIYGVCNKRFLGCSEPVRDDQLRDGEPCTPNEANGFAPCKGSCTPVDGAPAGSGLCSSFIDFADTPQCPDDPATMRPTGPSGDDARLCIYRKCESNADCTAPLTCKLNGFSSVCLY